MKYQVLKSDDGYMVADAAGICEPDAKVYPLTKDGKEAATKELWELIDADTAWRNGSDADAPHTDNY